MTKLIIVRHGETLENRLGILQGKMDTVLTKKGIQQAKDTALKLEGNLIDIIYSSPLTRARQTTSYIQKVFPKIKTVYDERLKEIDIGDYEGMTKQQVSLDQMDYPPNGENIEQVYVRVAEFVDEIREKQKDKTVLVVAHNVIIKTMFNHINYGEFRPLDRLNHVKNASFYFREL